MGVIASGGTLVRNEDVVRGLGIRSEVVQQVAEREGRELLRREQAYREGRPAPEIAGKAVIVVDDGLATGASMRAAIQALRQLRPRRTVVAVPAAPRVDLPRAERYGRRRGLRDHAVAVPLDETRALEPLERTAHWERGEVPETYPFTVLGPP